MSKPFEEFNLNRQLLNAVADAGFVYATPIQEKAIAPVLSGQDLFGIAQTGTGKTAAYALPVLMKLKYAQGNNLRALILAPTRELVLQIEEQVKFFSKYTDLRTVAVFGGVGPKEQKEKIAAGLDILVASPGRFLDIYLAGGINTRSLQFLVMDEADKMMDMGFIGAIHRILEILPRKRQNLLFTATMSILAQKIAGDFLKNPLLIKAAEQATPAKNVAQILYHVPNFKTKINLLQLLLKNEKEFKRLIIFCKTKQIANNIFSFICRRFGREEVRVLHANKGQNTRINAINNFKEGKVRVLVSTDVAARGIDVSEVSHVINFDVPIVIEDYVHRIGRTGRAFATGTAITFCSPSEVYYIQKIEQLIKQNIPLETIPEGVFIEQTTFDERQQMALEIDNQKKKENPEFKGAFHKKKNLSVITKANKFKIKGKLKFKNN